MKSRERDKQTEKDEEEKDRCDETQKNDDALFFRELMRKKGREVEKEVCVSSSLFPLFFQHFFTLLAPRPLPRHLFASLALPCERGASSSSPRERTRSPTSRLRE